MTLSRETGCIGHRAFSALPSLLRPGDLLVVNDTKVLRGRLRARRTGGGAVEIFLLSRLDGEGAAGERWEALARPSKRLSAGDTFGIGGALAARLDRRHGDGRWEVTLFTPEGTVADAIERVGEVPLPPYIRRVPGEPAGEEDARRYQTVYAALPGSVAAPTAGLHFDEDLLRELGAVGIGVARVTLSIGYGTFSPIRTEEVEEFAIHPERYRVTPEAAEAVNAARARGGRVVAVGTTSVRTLETCAGEDGTVAPSEGVTRKFIFPGYRFRAVDALLTNFHLPRSSLLALVMAFAGVDAVRAAYRAAVEEGYRFYSYGDAMLIR
ncbi:MAG: S-adenosylmethionine/tRNA-ribosyltransferase-isomerase [Deltaproteobacteria bacterium]|jgi:S-adenosylmethionine:tRNA ribosyltransferase-isomerase|nr:S-adenosylmethionine/tRNA-ribosyltransferase-isomerase [Deltaproteobacteria bacterium]